ncbi:SOS response-associated peptidase family protein [Mucilaginibacter rigui]|uniref:Abasic site processing protein n=1 Tax=Mucilaginibacter rigui TaxID=534635 RepID=A0ABR7X8B5_9SPHI|nr:SOS response-associated peptidase family protein [Mucilaginibacter rigui]MBD1385845.1 SOS response-associated peptidase family protein [Mucilaginibacter rigui]
MCYYNGQKVTRAEYIRLKSLEKAVSKFSFLDKGVINGFNGTPVAVLIPTEDRTNFDIVQMEWGLLPPHVKNREEVLRFRNGYKDEKTGKWKTGYTTLNAKHENLFINEWGKTSMFAEAARERRCLLLSTGFFEWQHIYRKHKKTGENLKTPDKYPYYINLPEHDYFFMAGIWQPWTDKETGEHVNTLAITTTNANHLMKQVHNSKERMPTILNDDLAWEWMMSDSLSDERIQEIASTQYPTELMSACTITKEFQALLDPTEPFTYADLPALELSIDNPSNTQGEQQISLF